MPETGTPRHESPLLALAWPLACLALILAGIALNIPPHRQALAFPVEWPATEAQILALAAGAGLAAVLCAATSLRALAWILPSLLVFAGLWLVLPVSPRGSIAWLLGLATLGATGWLAWRAARERPGAHGDRWFRGYAIADLAIIMLPLLAGAWLQRGLPGIQDAGEALRVLLLYPAYAVMQLAIFVLLPANGLRRLGTSPGAIALACAAAFSLVHWPNPLLMVCTGLAGLVWTRQHLRGRSLLAIALVMGVAASGFRLGIPERYTADMRIGPAYVAQQEAGE